MILNHKPISMMSSKQITIQDIERQAKTKLIDKTFFNVDHREKSKIAYWISTQMFSLHRLMEF
jgi:hypothetical protein